jgi:CheY-like chemotaxis protein
MNKKVLTVDDDNVTRKMLRGLLAKCGYLVTEASDGEQAIEQIAKDDFDVVICDVLMPRKNGWEVLQGVRSNPRTKDIPVIILTGEKEEEDILKGYDFGANYYMMKPFTKAQLLYGLQLVFSED